MLKEKKYSVYKNIEEVRLVLTNLETYAKVHPLIVSAKPLEISSPDQKIYEIIEQPYSWLPVKFTYQAQVFIANDTITYRLTGIPMFQPVIEYRLKSIDAKKTQVVFTLTISGNLMTQRLLANKMLKAQDQLMRNLDKSNQIRQSSH
jgi:hypothetical protein